MTKTREAVVFSSDVMGRVINMRLAKSNALLPLFETIINAIQAIEDAKTSDGKIYIKILRNPLSQGVSSDFTRGNINISGFIVEDNGIGFNPENLKSFLTADSTLKLSRGNKGIGRFLWLKAYGLVKIRSVYESDNGKSQIDFDFSIEEPYITNFREVKTDEGKSRGTKVKLDVMKMEFVDEIPKTAKAVARKIVEHFLTYYATDTAPEIIISDDAEGAFDIRSIFDEEIDSAAIDTRIEILGKEFNLKYLRNKNTTDNKHTIHLCAGRRDVRAELLEKYIPDLKHKLGEEDSYVIQAYLQGDYLNKQVNQERSQFDFSDANETVSPSLEKIMSFVVEDVKLNFADDIKVLKNHKEEKIREYVNLKSPKYRPLLRDRYSHLIDGISPNLSDDKLELELYKALSVVEMEVKQESAELLSRRGSDIVDMQQFRIKYDNLIDKLSDVSTANLAQHVVHRMMVIDLLEASLKLNDDNEYFLEESIHKIIHPLNTSSDQIHDEYQNLWLIDEKLVYHNYLASDKKLRTNPVVETDSLKEADIFGYFDTPHAFGEGKGNYQSIVIIEFKRPGKDSYSVGNDDPITQVYEYAEIIRSGRAKDVGGRPILDTNVPIYAYVVCDFTEKFQRIAKIHGMNRSYDGKKYYDYNIGLGCYIEAISFTTLAEEARLRNRVWFDKLHLPVR